MIVASWTLTTLHRFSPRDAAGWSLGHLFKFALLATAARWVLMWLLVKHDGQKLSELGLRQEQLKRSFVTGIPFGVGILVVCNVLIPTLTRGWFPGPEASPIGNWFQSLRAIPAWIFLGLIAGGLTEEAERAFVLTRFERTFGRAGLIVAIVLSSVMFGLGHLYQGNAAAFSLGVGGVLFALVYLRRRSCWEAVVAHGTFDAIGITMIFCR
jgi:membrane protease YdiL (CAAX protease family)